MNQNERKTVMRRMVLLIAVAVVFILRKVWRKRPKKEKLPKPAQTPPPAEYPVKPSDEPKPKY